MARWMTLVGVLVVAVFAVAAQGSEEVVTQVGDGTWDNTLIDFGGGYMQPNDEDSTPAPSVGINMGFPLPILTDWDLGWQIGGRGTFRDDDPDWLASAGLFRRTTTSGGKPLLWGFQGFYQNTYAKADLISTRSTYGIGINDKCSLSLVYTHGVNEEHVRRRATSKTNQQPVEEAVLLAGHQFNDDLRGEALAGFQFDDTDEIVLGLGLAFRRDEKTNFNIVANSNFDGDYSVRLGLSFDLGARGRSSHQTYVHADADGDYTPLPVDGLATIRYNTQVSRF